jgi:hypothetical protein
MNMTSWPAVGLAALLVSNICLPPPNSGELILWNKLGSVDEVQHSAVGPNGHIVGTVLFEPSQHGNGFRSAPRTGDPNVPDNFVRFHLPKLGSQGTIEFWYHPNWMDWGVGHVIDLIQYGVPENPGSVVQALQFNDWQNRGSVWARDDSSSSKIAVEYFYPSSDPQWSTAAPIHLAYTWDASADKKVVFYINGEPSGSGYFDSNPDFLWPFVETRYLYVGSRMYSGDWYRHNWEPNVDGIIDNIKVWDYAKTDFSDRFKDRPTSKIQCKNGTWSAFGFKNQGQCIKFVNTGK